MKYDPAQSELDTATLVLGGLYAAALIGLIVWVA